MERPGVAGQCNVWHGSARQGYPRKGCSASTTVRFRRRGPRSGEVRHSPAVHGLVRLGEVIHERMFLIVRRFDSVGVGCGKAWHGVSWHGCAWQGDARLLTQRHHGS